MHPWHPIQQTRQAGPPLPRTALQEHASVEATTSSCAAMTARLKPASRAQTAAPSARAEHARPTGRPASTDNSAYADQTVKEFDATKCEMGCDIKGVRCLDCTASQHACFGQCAELNDRLHCGTSCQECPDFGVYGSSSCDGSQCQITCTATGLACENQERVEYCANNHVSFEDQAQSVMVIGVTNKRAHTGAHSLQAKGSVGYTYTFCPNGAEAILAGRSVVAWVYVESNGRSYENGVSCRLAASLAQEPTDTPVTLDEWVNLRVTTEQTPTRSTSIGLTCWPNDVDVYIDDVAIR
jgi:hypothetical protein